VGAEELAGVEVKGVGVVASRVIGGGVEGVEAVEFGFDLGTVGEGEAEAAEDLDRAILDKGEGVEGADRELTCGHRDIEVGDGGGVGGILELLLAVIERSADGLAGGVEGSTEFGFVLIGEITHLSSEGVERTLFAEEFDAGVLKGGFGGSGFDSGECFGLDLCGLLGHARDWL
jgi:hypothetical protein